MTALLVQSTYAGRTRNRDIGSAPPASRPPTGCASAAPAQSSRPTLLGAAFARMEWLAGGRPDRATCHGRRVASPPVRVAVAMAFDALASRSPSHRSQLRALIQKMHRANRLWGAPHIHGELQKLGIEIAETTVAKYFGRRRRRPHRPGARSCERISPSVPQWTFSSPRRPSGSCLSSSFSRTTAAASSI